MTQSPSRRPVGPFRLAFYWVSWIVGQVLFRVYFRMRKRNRPAPFPTGPLVLAANHCSFLDPVLFALCVPRRVVFMVTSDMYYLPLLRPVLWMFGCIPVQEDRRNVQAMRDALAELRAGRVVGIFPEGGISRDGRLAPGLTGVASLILQGNAPVLPAALTGTYRAMARHQRFPRPVQLGVEFATLLNPADLAEGHSRAEARAVVRDRVMQEIARGLPEEQQSLSEVDEPAPMA